MIGAYHLQLVRPDKAGSILFFGLGYRDCYQDLSFITWYMDKNRPLPPHKDFDLYREKDFSVARRKNSQNRCIEVVFLHRRPLPNSRLSGKGIGRGNVLALTAVL
jgi:hypothetical protein